MSDFYAVWLVGLVGFGFGVALSNYLVSMKLSSCADTGIRWEANGKLYTIHMEKRDD